VIPSVQGGSRTSASEACLISLVVLEGALAHDGDDDARDVCGGRRGAAAKTAAAAR